MEDDFTSPGGEPVAPDPESVDGPAESSEWDVLGHYGTGNKNSCPTGAESPGEPVEPDPESVDSPAESSEWDVLGHYGTGNKNSCPTGAESPQFQGLSPDLDLDEPGSEASYSLLARDLLEALDSDDDGPDEDELPDSSLTERQMAALPYVAAFPNVRQAARAAGVGKSTIYRWMEDDEFRNEVTRLRKASAEIAELELQGLMLTAVEVLCEVMNHDDAAIRLRAARYVLDFGMQAGEIAQLRKDLADLRQAVPPWNPGMSIN